MLRVYGITVPLQASADIIAATGFKLSGSRQVPVARR